MRRRVSLFLTCFLLCGIRVDCLGVLNPVSLADFATRSHSQYIDHGNGKFSLKSGRHRFDFSVGTKEFYADGTKVYLTYPVSSRKKLHWRSLLKSRLRKQDVDVLIEQVDIDKIIKPLLFPRVVGGRKVKVIVIDPGHGGKADGARNTCLKLKEKDLVLKFAKKLAAELKKQGYIVYLTRTCDVDVSLEGRAIFANKRSADLFISVHCNSATNPKANGIEVFTYTFAGHPSTDQAKLNRRNAIVTRNNRFDVANTYLAWRLQYRLCRELQMTDRGVRKARMGVLGPTNCPSVLIECGFLSNLKEASNMCTDVFLVKLARAVCGALRDYAEACR